MDILKRNLAPVSDAGWVLIADVEDSTLFSGLKEGHIRGLTESVKGEAIPVQSGTDEILDAVSDAPVALTS